MIVAVRQQHGSNAAQILDDIKHLRLGAVKPAALSIFAIENPPDSNSIFGSTEFVQGASLPHMIECQQQAVRILERDPNVASVISILGAQMHVRLKSQKERQLNTDQIIEELRDIQQPSLGNRSLPLPCRKRRANNLRRIALI